MRLLVEKIVAAAPGVRSISLELNNISSVPANDSVEIQQAIAAQLGKKGIRTVSTASADAQVKITLSEGEEGCVWAAEIRHGDEVQVAIIDAGRASRTASNELPTMSLRREEIWRQAQPFLDFITDETDPNNSHFVLLEPKDLLAYSVGKTGTELRVEGSISKVNPTRDLRGEIISIDATTARAYVEGVNCKGSWGATIEVDCDPHASLLEGENPFAAGRNYYTAFGGSGSTGGTNPAKFFTAAIATTGGANPYILAEVDAKARLYDNSTSAVATFEGWGDEIATIHPGCDDGWQVLVTGTGDWTQPDQIQIYEIRGHAAIAVGEPLNFPGPILSLSPAPDGKSARVVSRNLQTGMYEASIVSVTCGN